MLNKYTFHVIQAKVWEAAPETVYAETFEKACKEFGADEWGRQNLSKWYWYGQYEVRVNGNPVGVCHRRK